VEERRKREPAMRAMLSASPSRPWALAGSGSSGLLASDVSEFVAREPEYKPDMIGRESQLPARPFTRRASDPTEKVVQMFVPRASE
jgi:hypothetical protein